MGDGQAADEGGLATFLVPLRHPETHETYSGLTIGDMGLKVGLNGVDNGFLLFDNYRLPPEAILSRPNNSRKSNSSLSGLSMGRVGIVNLSNRNLHMAVVIAVRYSAVRRQFGPSNSVEWPIIEYQTQQCRLFPYLAASFVHHHLSSTLFLDFVDFAYTSKIIDAFFSTTMLSNAKPTRKSTPCHVRLKPWHHGPHRKGLRNVEKPAVVMATLPLHGLESLEITTIPIVLTRETTMSSFNRPPIGCYPSLTNHLLSVLQVTYRCHYRLPATRQITLRVTMEL